MTHPSNEARDVYYQAFTRDEHKCVFCGRDILESFNSFSASHLDHLKPSKSGGTCNDVLNRVTACGVCSNIKGSFDPYPDGPITVSTFDKAVAAARSYISEKREGKGPYHRDYNYWLKETDQKAG